MKVFIRKPDLDTCLTSIIMGVRESDDLVVVRENAPFHALADREVLCIEAGGSGLVHLNNFDHHSRSKQLPPACYQAYMLRCSDTRNRSLEKLVSYVVMVDTADPHAPFIAFPSLSNIFSGMCLVSQDYRVQFREGLAIIAKGLEAGLDPFSPVPDIVEWREWRRAKEENTRQLREDCTHATFFESRNGLRVGFLESKAYGGFGYFYRQGCDVAILFNPTFGDPPVRKYTIASQKKRVADLLPDFDIIEPGWNGQPKIIGSPGNGSCLSEKEVLSLVLASL